jgi:hypothetical protein
MNEETSITAAPVAAPALVAQPKKKRTGCIVATVILVLLLCCCLASAAVIWPLVSIYLGASNPKPVDLGVKYSQADVASISKKTGIAIDTGYGQPNAGTAMFYGGTKQVSAALTQAEFSAYLNYLNSPRLPITEVQVKIENKSQAQISTLVTYQNHSYPVLATVTGTVKGATATGSFQIIKVNGFTIPAQYRDMVTKFVLDLINSRLARVNGLNITRFEFQRGQLIIEGTFPAKAWRASEATPTVPLVK